MSKRSQSSKELGEQGMISITVTVVFVLVISLIVLGFSQVTQRNGKLALDRQLSSQASYAAEVGINDAMNAIAGYIDSKKVFDGTKPFPEQTDCNGSYNRNDGQVYDGDDSVRYTCLLVKQPKDISASNVSSSSLIWPLDATGNNNLEQIDISWDRAADTPGKSVSDCGTGDLARGKNPLASTWVSKCQFGMLRIDLIKNEPSVMQSPESAAAATMTLFLYPRTALPGATDPPAYSYDILFVPNVYGTSVAQGLVGDAGCNENTCTARISNLAFKEGYIRIKSLYQSASTVKISQRSSSGTSVGLENAQVVIDVTGKAQDVLRRVQARAPIRGTSSKQASNYFSDFSIESTDSLCKRFNTSPRVGNTQVPANSGC